MEDFKRVTVIKGENREYCKRIADKLENLVNGEFVKIDGDAVEVFYDDETGARWCVADGVFYSDDDFTDHDGIFHNSYETEAIYLLDNYTLYDYFSDVLDINWILNSDFEYKGVRLMVTCGGPNVFIDTVRGRVELYWWAEYADFDLDNDVINAINDLFEEDFNCRRCF